MTFTPHEQKLIARLRKQESRWRYMRWVYIGIALIVFGLYAWLLWRVYGFVKTENGSDAAAFILALAYPKVLFGLTFTACLIAYVVRDWWGSPSRALLLKLIEAHAQETPPKQ